ncbi:MAG TPA: FKBP-type peptidyl-prolyl cis-trans isomerase [Chitinophagales bacterium]|nr:FKBP-type peptidyl-prolyl cis-trans isomerase [Chitinophagales bacterium]
MLKNKFSLYIVIILLTFSSCTTNDDYKTSPNGLKYKIIVDNGKPKAQTGQYIAYHISWRTLKDSLIFTTEQRNALQIDPVRDPVSKSDLQEIFHFLGAGDSASCNVKATTIFHEYLPASMKPDDMMKVDFKVLNVLSKEQGDSIVAAKASENLGAEDRALQDFMHKNNLKGIRTPSGMYVVMETEGSGKQPVKGNTVRVAYTGKLLDGTMFDSSFDPGHQPYEFVIETGNAIKGWHEGLQYFKVGGKGKLLIPSELAYGDRGSPPKIGPNQPLVFDIELLSIK